MNSVFSLKFSCENSNFIFNKATESVVYIVGPLGSRMTSQVNLESNVFVNNTGVPIYISHSNLQIFGSLWFEGNVGGGIYSKVILMSALLATLLKQEVGQFIKSIPQSCLRRTQ